VKGIENGVLGDEKCMSKDEVENCRQYIRENICKAGKMEDVNCRWDIDEENRNEKDNPVEKNGKYVKYECEVFDRDGCVVESLESVRLTDCFWNGDGGVCTCNTTTKIKECEKLKGETCWNSLLTLNCQTYVSG
jgi:hypothetical protein